MPQTQAFLLMHPDRRSSVNYCHAFWGFSVAWLCVCPPVESQELKNGSIDSVCVPPSGSL